MHTYDFAVGCVCLVLPPEDGGTNYYVKGLFFVGTKISLSLAGREDRFETERSPKRLLQLTISAKFRTIWNSFPTYLCMYVLQNEHGQPY